MLSELEDLAHRLEQQLVSYEKLHADEMKRFEEQLAAYRNLQNDELQMLRHELSQLNLEIEQLKQEEATKETEPAPTPTDHTAASPVPLAVTRRELLTGKLPLPSHKQV